MNYAIFQQQLHAYLDTRPNPEAPLPPSLQAYCDAHPDAAAYAANLLHLETTLQHLPVEPPSQTLMDSLYAIDQPEAAWQPDWKPEAVKALVYISPAAVLMLAKPWLAADAFLGLAALLLSAGLTALFSTLLKPQLLSPCSL